MKKLVSQILVVLFLAIPVTAQTDVQKSVLFDEFERPNLEELMSRLDIFISASMKTPNTKGHIRISGGNEECFLCNYYYGSLINAYLKNTRKISIEKYSIEYCDKNTGNLLTQLYLLPPTSKLPECQATLEIPKKSALFETVTFFYKDNKLSPLEDWYIEIGPSQGVYSVNVLQKVKNILDKSPDSLIYIIVYLGTNPGTKVENKNGTAIEKKVRNLDKKSLAKKLLLNARKEFIKNGINPSRIKTLEAGYVEDRRQLQFWFIPKGGEISKPKPNYFPK